VERFPGKIYANDVSKLRNAVQATPDVLAHPSIVAHVARAGWGSIWLSILTGKPLVVPPYEADEDPEIFFNIQRIEELGIGMVFAGQPPSELLAEVPRMRARMEELRKTLRKRFGTLDGIGYAARKIVEDLLQKAAALR
jgi:UDP:flavonoid glycosyltransferase YjiC (YdhE family)